jgi:alpha,alpha-trehalase
MKKLICLWLCLPPALTVIAQAPPTPEKIYGQLFRDIQLQRIYPDGKTFVDCLPKRDPKDIMYDYGMMKGPRFNLKKFADDNFELPPSLKLNYITQEKDLVMHIKNLWAVLKREPGKQTAVSSLVPLPYPYIVTGGRYRELYYRDAYYIMLGLKESGETDMVENMVKDFSWMIDTLGYIPAGNRTYYTGRSQPPCFSLMVEMLAEIKGDQVYAIYLPELQKEYGYWMEGDSLVKNGQALRRIVKLKDGTLFNRYWEENSSPREENYREDIAITEKTKRNKTAFYQQLRAADASGWGFSSRWMADGKNLSSLQTSSIVPVDLNSLLYKLELVIARAKLLAGDEAGAAAFRKKADNRLYAIDKYCWNRMVGFYTDYNFITGKAVNLVTPAGIYPFCFFNRKPDYMSLLARKVSPVIRENLLKDGGIVTTPNTSGQQWDAPYGRAALQWMMVWGLNRCGQRELARDIAERWIKLNTAVYNRSGRLLEKYNVVNIATDDTGDATAGQDGVGTTGGVLLKLTGIYGPPKD